jgi:hypothetical protein
MARNTVVSVVSRMPFSGVRAVRPAALRGAIAARAGDSEMLAISDSRIAEIQGINRLIAGIGTVVMAASTYATVRTGSPIHAAEATLGGMVAVGHGAAAYAQHCIRERLQGLAVRSEARMEAQVPAEVTADVIASDASAEQPPYPDYPGFYTPAPRFSETIDNVSAYGSVLSLGHALFSIVTHHTQ